MVTLPFYHDYGRLNYALKHFFCSLVKLFAILGKCEEGECLSMGSFPDILDDKCQIMRHADKSFASRYSDLPTTLAS